MRYIISLFLLCAAFFAQAQTKVIAHKSHSGSKASFAKAYRLNLFGNSNANFGLPGNANIIVIDTVLAVNKQTTIIKYRESNVCYRFGTHYTKLLPDDYTAKTITLTKDTLYNKANTPSYIKKHMRWEPLNFDNPVESIVFIGFRKED